MAEQSFVPDFSEFYNQYELSDVSLFIQEEEHAAPCSSSSSGIMSGEEEEEEACEPVAEQGPSKPRRKALPGHSMVLVAFSAFFKAKVRPSSCLCMHTQQRGKLAQHPAQHHYHY